MTRARDLARFANNQALSVDGDLEVGINSTSPAAKLDVRGNVVYYWCINCNHLCW